MSYQEIIESATKAKAELDTYRPFEGDLLKSVQDYYRVSCTYTSNQIEGFSYTETETKVLLEDGLTAGGKPLKDLYAVLGHAKAYDYMFTLLKQDGLTENNILQLHAFLEGSLENNATPGQYRTTQIFMTGTDYIFLQPKEVPSAIANFIVKLDSMKSKCHPIELATYAHKEIATIHPFADGNGRVSRLAMNTLLIQNGYLPAIIPPILRNEYISALKKTNKGHDDDFKNLIARATYEELKSMKRMLQGSTLKDIDSKESPTQKKTKRPRMR